MHIPVVEAGANQTEADRRYTERTLSKLFSSLTFKFKFPRRTAKLYIAYDDLIAVTPDGEFYLEADIKWPEFKNDSFDFANARLELPGASWMPVD
jgi:hypothetical protein